MSEKQLEKQAQKKAETLQLDGFLRVEMPDFAMSASELERAISSLRSDINLLAGKLGHSNNLLKPLRSTLLSAEQRLDQVKHEEEIKENSKSKQAVFDIARAANANKAKEEKEPKQAKGGTMADMLADLSELLKSNNITHAHLRLFLNNNHHRLSVLKERNDSFGALHNKLQELVAGKDKVGSGDHNKLSKEQAEAVKAFVESLDKMIEESVIDRKSSHLVGYFTNLVMRQREGRGQSFAQSVR